MTRLPPALVLTAGIGSRLFPLTLTRAKPAAPVAGVPLIVRILRWLSSSGVGDAVLNLHHRPAGITAVVGDGSHCGLRVRYSWEHPVVLGSAGGPRHALPLLDADRWLIVNGDTLTLIDLASLVDAHRSGGGLATLAVVPNHAPDRYGGVLVADDGAIVDFTRRGDTRPSWHFVGLQMVETAVFAPLADGLPLDSVSGVYRTLLRSHPGAIRAWRTSGLFEDIGTPGDYLRTSLAIRARENGPEQLVGARCRVAPSAVLQDSILWDDVTVEHGVVLERCVLADGVVVRAGRRYRDVAMAPAAAASALPPGARFEDELVLAPLDPYGPTA